MTKLVDVETELPTCCSTLKNTRFGNTAECGPTEVDASALRVTFEVAGAALDAPMFKEGT